VPDAHHWIAFITAAALLAAIPGPGVLYVLARSLGGGVRAGLWSTAGTATGGLVQVTAAVLGLSAVLAASATAFEIIRLVGAAYLIWLGSGHRGPPRMSRPRRVWS
jgi:threonine/homoserine/homoserine lactone efflux protein